MDKTISLVGSKTFWSALLALAAVIAQAFGWSKALAIIADPNTLNNILNGVAMVGTIGAIVFRASATTKVTSVVPPAK